jgi:hypothetical protein
MHAVVRHGSFVDRFLLPALRWRCARSVVISDPSCNDPRLFAFLDSCSLLSAFQAMDGDIRLSRIPASASRCDATICADSACCATNYLGRFRSCVGWMNGDSIEMWNWSTDWFYWNRRRHFLQVQLMLTTWLHPSENKSCDTVAEVLLIITCCIWRCTALLIRAYKTLTLLYSIPSIRYS